MNEREELVAEMREFGLNVTVSTLKQSTPSKKFINCKVLDGSKGYSGWYVNHGGACTYGRFDRDITKYWSSYAIKCELDKMSYYQRKHYYEQQAKYQETIKLIEIEERKKKFIGFLTNWNKYPYASPALPYDEYFKRKQIKIFNDFKIIPHKNNTTCIPLYSNIDKQLAGCQYVYTTEEGTTKRFATGTRFKGAFYPIRNNNDIHETWTIFLAEGYATAYSLNEILKYCPKYIKFMTFACFGASNLVDVANYVRVTFPHIKIIVCADNDLAGITYAKKASPNWFVFSYDSKINDANDVYCTYGLKKSSEMLNLILF